MLVTMSDVFWRGKGFNSSVGYSRRWSLCGSWVSISSIVSPNGEGVESHSRVGLDGREVSSVGSQ
jgi:hypothetical protein